MNLTDKLEAASAALEAHREATLDELSSTEETMVDLLTNMRHLCNAEDLDFQAIARMSLLNFKAERE